MFSAEELINENDYQKNLIDYSENQRVDNNQEEGTKTMTIWSILILVNIIVFLLSLHSSVFFETPLKTIAIEVRNNVSKAQTFIMNQPVENEPTLYQWNKVVAATINDYFLTHSQRLTDSHTLGKTLLDTYKTFDNFIEQVSNGNKTLVVDDIVISIVNLKKLSTYNKFRDVLLETHVGVIKQGLFTAKRGQEFILQSTNDGLFHPGPFVQIKPKNTTEVNYYDPVFYEAVGYDNNFITRLDAPSRKASTSGVDESDNSNEFGFFTQGAFYVRSPFGNKTWQSLDSLSMKSIIPAISSKSIRTWIACNDSNLIQCTNLKCRKDSGLNGQKRHNIPCDKQPFGLVGSKTLGGYPMISLDQLTWYYYVQGDDTPYLVNGSIAEELLEPYENTVINYQNTSSLGYGAISYVVLSEMERIVDVQTGAGYFTFDVEVSNK
ncbi:Hypothetical protein EHI5A_107140 [Entamoeba histolytica KU27]|uniref:Uncharacterized protein n=1 Tax=Entamoeba histolytica KU27 TaxID=885311 RepID=M2Q5H1_ENTHI|nr:Hypothetical protein EHI5A_107140 [Entamoeba histolytica KU27]